LKKRVITAIIAFLVVAVSVFALCTPQTFVVYTISDADDALIESFESDDIVFYSDCTVDDNGVIDVNEEGFPCIVIDLEGSGYNSVVLNFAENVDGMQLELCCDTGDGFDEANAQTLFMQEADTDFVVPIDSSVKSVQINLTEDCDFDSLELHSSEPVLEEAKHHTKPSVIILSAALAALAALAVIVSDWKFNYLSKIVIFKKEYLITAVKLVAAAAISAGLGVLAEYAYGRFFAEAAAFSPYRAAFFAGAAFCIASLIVFFKELKEKPEKAFLCISLTLCILFVFLTPFGHACWDAESHYRFTLNTSYIGEDSYYSLADEKVMKISPDYWPAETAGENVAHISAMNDSYSTLLGYTSGMFSPAHTPAALAMALGRLVGMSFYNVTNLSKLANSLFYCLACFLAIRRLKSGKMIAAVIALFPTTLFLAANLSYDPWVTALGMLGMAYFVGIQQEGEGYVKTTDILIMCIAFGLSIVPKLLYAPLLLIPLFMNPKRIDKKKKYYLICIATMVIFGGLLMLRSLMILKGGGDTRGGSDVNTVGQVKFILADPMGYAKLLLGFLRNYLSFDSMKQYITNFAYLGMSKGSIVFIVLMALTALTDKNEYDKKSYTVLSKLYVIALYFGMAVLIATSMYVAFTPVGSQEINGCQPRYLIPLIYPLLSIVGWNGLNNKLNRTFYNSVIMLACVGVNLYCIYTKLLIGWA